MGGGMPGMSLYASSTRLPARVMPSDSTTSQRVRLLNGYCRCSRPSLVSSSAGRSSTPVTSRATAGAATMNQPMVAPATNS